MSFLFVKNSFCNLKVNNPKQNLSEYLFAVHTCVFLKRGYFRFGQHVVWMRR